MKKKIDENMPAGKMTRIADVLPPPHELSFPPDAVKVTISLSKMSVEFFKREAGKNHTKYQKLIRAVLDHYARHYHSNY